jgi:hypothetical protein
VVVQRALGEESGLTFQFLNSPRLLKFMKLVILPASAKTSKEHPACFTSARLLLLTTTILAATKDTPTFSERSSTRRLVWSLGYSTTQLWSIDLQVVASPLTLHRLSITEAIRSKDFRTLTSTVFFTLLSFFIRPHDAG